MILEINPKRALKEFPLNGFQLSSHIWRYWKEIKEVSGNARQNTFDESQPTPLRKVFCSPSWKSSFKPLHHRFPNGTFLEFFSEGETHIGSRKRVDSATETPARNWILSTRPIGIKVLLAKATLKPHIVSNHTRIHWRFVICSQLLWQKIMVSSLKKMRDLSSCWIHSADWKLNERP